jgi:DNA-binding transcriptional MerR regulator
MKAVRKRMTRKAKKPAPGKPTGPAGLKMQELVAASGLAKSTILHYLNEGLLQAPVKTSRNMAYYSPECLERLSFIKVMQGKYRFSLAMIKQFLQEGKSSTEIEPFLELRSFIFDGPGDQELLDLAAFCRATGLTTAEVEELQRAELLLPLDPERFDAEDQAIGRVLKRCRELGLPLEEATFYPRLAQQIVDHEMALRDRLIKGLSLEANATLTLEMTRGARTLRPYIIDRVFQRRVMSRTSIASEEED